VVWSLYPRKVEPKRATKVRRLLKSTGRGSVSSQPADCSRPLPGRCYFWARRNRLLCQASRSMPAAEWRPKGGRWGSLGTDD